MIVNNTGQPIHLSYCTNIHAGETWSEVFPTLQTQIPNVRRALDLQGPMGIGLRLSRLGLDDLQRPDQLSEFKSWLELENFYVYTINGFPYGRFHGERVKEDVYKPDWTEKARLEYTCKLADLLCKLKPPENYGSISTLPGTYKDWNMPGTEQLISQNLIKAVAHCVRLEQDTGITIALALEPEPCCLLETVTETIDFFKTYLFSETAIDRLMALCDITHAEAERAMHAHIGVCYDVCHSAVEFEDPVSVVTRLRTAGIDIVKIQLSSALEIKSLNEASLKHLSRFDEPVYLHQVVEKRAEVLTRYTDVGCAVDAVRHRFDAASNLHPTLKLTIDNNSALSMTAQGMHEAQWRIHYHVPVFISETEHFSTTQQSLKDVLQLQKKFTLTRHLEIETYTWDVLPAQYRQQSVSEAIANEYRWIQQHM